LAPAELKPTELGSRPLLQVINRRTLSDEGASHARWQALCLIGYPAVLPLIGVAVGDRERGDVLSRLIGFRGRRSTPCIRSETVSGYLVAYHTNSGQPSADCTRRKEQKRPRTYLTRVRVGPRTALTGDRLASRPVDQVPRPWSLPRRPTTTSAPTRSTLDDPSSARPVAPFLASGNWAKSQRHPWCLAHLLQNCRFTLQPETSLAGS
jgi:hypothetical protein